jgi:tetratricopeptide (TPR) repeat protein
MTMVRLSGRGERRVTAVRVLIGAVVTWVWLLGASAVAFRGVEVGAEAPDFSLESTTGRQVSLSDFRGKAVLLAFVRQGQEKSAKTLADLSRLDPALGDQVQVVAVVVNPDKGDAEQWASEVGATFPVLVDTTGEVYGGYGVLVLPSTGVIEPEGTLRGEVNGHTASFKGEVERHAKTVLGLATTAAAEEKVGPAKSEERKTAERHLQKARILTKRKMKEKAAVAAREAVAADGSYTDAQEFLGNLLLDLSDDNADEARGHFEKALELDPRSSEAKVGLARVKSIQGDSEGAAAILEEAARLNPRPEKLYYQLGLVYERAKQYEKAVAAYRKALDRLLK